MKEDSDKWCRATSAFHSYCLPFSLGSPPIRLSLTVEALSAMIGRFHPLHTNISTSVILLSPLNSLFLSVSLSQLRLSLPCLEDVNPCIRTASMRRSACPLQRRPALHATRKSSFRKKHPYLLCAEGRRRKEGGQEARSKIVDRPGNGESGSRKQRGNQPDSFVKIHHFCRHCLPCLAPFLLPFLCPALLLPFPIVINSFFHSFLRSFPSSLISFLLLLLLPSHIPFLCSVSSLSSSSFLGFFSDFISSPFFDFFFSLSFLFALSLHPTHVGRWSIGRLLSPPFLLLHLFFFLVLLFSPYPCLVLLLFISVDQVVDPWTGSSLIESRIHALILWSFSHSPRSSISSVSLSSSFSHYHCSFDL